MVKTSRRDYKFPGGALEINEVIKEALAREVKEESGYKDCVIINYLGKVIERRKDKYNPHLSFNMISEYYLCSVGAKSELELSDNEKTFDF
jgi:ADP-ribose pyrophosphatase YjhB (NUDIX family)